MPRLKTKGLFIVGLLLFSLSAHARDVEDYKYPRDPKGWSWFEKFYAKVGPSFKLGSMKTQDGSTVPKVTLSSYGFDAHIGRVFSLFNFGAGAEYHQWSQLSDPADVNNINTNGTQTSYYLVAGTNLRAFSLFGKYYLNSEYEFSQKSSSSEQVLLDGVKSSFSVELIYHLSHYTYVSLSYNQTSFEKFKQANTTGELDEDIETKLSSIGLNIGIIF